MSYISKDDEFSGESTMSDTSTIATHDLIMPLEEYPYKMVADRYWNMRHDRRYRNPNANTNMFDGNTSKNGLFELWLNAAPADARKNKILYDHRGYTFSIE